MTDRDPLEWLIGIIGMRIATAPAPAAVCGTSAPTAKNLVATAIPNFPLARSRAMIDQVTRAPSATSVAR